MLWGVAAIVFWFCLSGCLEKIWRDLQEIVALLFTLVVNGSDSTNLQEHPRYLQFRHHLWPDTQAPSESQLSVETFHQSLLAQFQSHPSLTYLARTRSLKLSTVSVSAMEILLDYWDVDGQEDTRSDGEGMGCCVVCLRREVDVELACSHGAGANSPDNRLCGRCFWYVCRTELRCLYCKNQLPTTSMQIPQLPRKTNDMVESNS